MARIVPPGVNPNLGVSLEDPLDKIIKLVELGSKAVGAYQNVQQQYRTDIGDTLKNIVDIMPGISSQEGFTALTNSLNDVSSKASKTGDSSLQLYADTVKAMHSGRQKEFGAYKKAFNEVLSISGNPDGWLSPENLNIDNITSWKIEDINSTYNQLAALTSQMYQADGKTPKFASYRLGEEDASTVQGRLNNALTQMNMAMKSLMGDGIITRAEANFILTARASDLKEHRTLVTEESKDKINNFNQSIDNYKKTQRGLEIDKDLQLYKAVGKYNILQDMMAEPEYAHSYTELGGATLGELQSGINGEKGINLYNSIVGELGTQTGITYTQLQNEITRYNKWSPVLWKPDTLLTPPGGEVIVDSDDEPKSVSTEEGTFDEEGNLIVEEEFKPKVDYTPGKELDFISKKMRDIVYEDTIDEIVEEKKGSPFALLSKDKKQQVVLEYRNAVKNNSALYRLTPQAWYNSLAKSKEINKPTEQIINIDDFLGTLAQGNNLTAKDIKYVKASSRSGWSTNTLLSLVRKYKIESNVDKKNKLKSDIEQLIK